MDYQEEQEQNNEDAEALLNDELMKSGEAAKRRMDFLTCIEDGKSFAQIVDYKFDADKEQWCEVINKYICIILIIYLMPFFLTI